jgi:hypothetical protein
MAAGMPIARGRHPPGLPRSMLFRTLLSLTTLAASGTLAQVAAPAADACRTALGALQAAEDRFIAARRASAPAASAAAASTVAAAPGGASRPAGTPGDALKAARQQAARACLGGAGDPPPPTARTLPPAEMPRAPAPPTARLPPLPARAPVPAVTVPPPSVDRPVIVTSCDPGGCWSSDGIWRPRVGPTLGGPAGLCTRQGVLVSCP